MPRGLEGVRAVAADREARRQAAASGNVMWFKLPKSGDSAIVRFLEEGEDVHWMWMHELPPAEGKQWGLNTACLDQSGDGTPCPGCETGRKRKFQGYINLIWRDAPVYKKNEDGFFEKENNKLIKIGEEDQIAVWNSGLTVFEELDGKDATYKGLCGRDFKVTRKGTGLSTKYVIEPADPDGGKQPLSDADEKIADEKYDLLEITQPMDYDELRKKFSQGGSSSGSGDSDGEGDPAEEGGDVNPFMRR